MMSFITCSDFDTDDCISITERVSEKVFAIIEDAFSNMLMLYRSIIYSNYSDSNNKEKDYFKVEKS